MSAYTAEDFAGLNHGALMMEAQFFTASVGYHEIELTNARAGLQMVEAELARRQAAKEAA